MSDDQSPPPPPPLYSLSNLSNPAPAITRSTMAGQRNGPVSSTISSPLGPAHFSSPTGVTWMSLFQNNNSAVRVTGPDSMFTTSVASQMGASAFAADFAFERNRREREQQQQQQFQSYQVGMEVGFDFEGMEEEPDDGLWQISGTRGSLINVADYPFGSYRPPSFSNFSTVSVDSTLVDFELDTIPPQEFDLTRTPTPNFLDEDLGPNVRKSFEDCWDITFGGESEDEKKFRLEEELRRFEVEELLKLDMKIDLGLRMMGW